MSKDPKFADSAYQIFNENVSETAKWFKWIIFWLLTDVNKMKERDAFLPVI